MQRTAYLFKRDYTTAPALANATYSTGPSAALGEEAVYHPGLHDAYAAQARVTRAALGVTSKLKFQGTADQPEPLILGAGNAQVSLIAAAPGKSIQTAQATGASASTSHSTAAGLTTVTLGTDANGRPSTTAQAFADYITANLSATFTPTVLAGSGIMGAMLRAAAVPEAPAWGDLQSTRHDTGVEAAEHTIDPGAGASVTVEFLVQTRGCRAVRAIATGTGAPASGDAVIITMAVPG